MYSLKEKYINDINFNYMDNENDNDENAFIYNEDNENYIINEKGNIINPNQKDLMVICRNCYENENFPKDLKKEMFEISDIGKLLYGIEGNF
jgi:hypothetical protein